MILTGAGISAESGIATFRDANGLWEGHDIMQVASPQGWEKNPELVLEFYNKRRAQLQEVQPNDAHYIIADLEKEYQVNIITQNVDDLHERAGSSNVLHLHGELCKVRSTVNHHNIKNWKKDLHLGDLCNDGYQLRPHIVWFGEDVPAMTQAIEITQRADIFLIVGTSLQVYPAAGLSNYTHNQCHHYYIDLNPAVRSSTQMTIIKDKATSGMQQFLNIIKNS